MSFRFSALCLAVVGAASCERQDDAFYAEVFTCDITAAEDQCGTDRSGNAMICYDGSQLGGRDICTPRCDPKHPPDDPRVTCLSSGALLWACQPHGGPNGSPIGCPSGLQCYRTDLFVDEGVCLKMAVCTADTDCKDTAHRVCAASIVRGFSQALAGADDLQCVQAMCKSAGSSCASTESCLAEFYIPGIGVPEICVPNCNPKGNCPPNFSCAMTPDTPQSPPICLPGLPGQRCQNEQDCLLGHCVDTGAGFSECTLPFPCIADTDCAYLDGAATFVCAEGVPGAGSRCVALNSFNGANCTDSSGCRNGLDCFDYSPYQIGQGHGECRLPCDADQHCPMRGGVPHVCLDSGKGGCYPGILGLPCTSSSECLPDFMCLPVSPDPRTRITNSMVCTTSCLTDLDCQNNPLIRKTGFCSEGLCRLVGEPGAPCDRDAQCGATTTCQVGMNSTGLCAS